MDFAAIDRKKALLDAYHPLPAHTMESLRESIYLDWTYHSNGIEGNTLTLRETKVVLEGITVGDKTLREHLEAINHRDAILFLEDLVSKSEPLSEWNIKSLYLLVLKGIDDENAGRYESAVENDPRGVSDDALWLSIAKLDRNGTGIFQRAWFIYHDGRFRIARRSERQQQPSADGAQAEKRG